MKKFMLPCALLIASAMLCPIAAEETPAAPEEIHDRIAYGTPTVDGELDELYLRSEKIDCKLKPWYLMDKSEAEAKPELISWDTGVEAYSYMLWDESNLYVYFSVKDNTPGIVDYEKAEAPASDSAIYTYQDGISVSFEIGGRTVLFADRGGRFFAPIKPYDATALKPISGNTGENGKGLIGLNKDYFVTVNSSDGYTAELCIPLTSEGAKQLTLGAKHRFYPGVYNYSDSLPYSRFHVGEPGIYRVAGFEYGAWYGEYATDGSLFFDTGDSATVIRRYIDLVGAGETDLNGDGKLNTADLVRLMKLLAANETPSPAHDVNLDGAVDVRDLVALMKHIAHS